MSLWRLVVAALTAGILLLLMSWQVHRERMINACLEEGHIWDGPRSACRPLRNRPILQRDLQRS